MKIIGSGDDEYIVMMSSAELRDITGTPYNKPIKLGATYDVMEAVRNFEAIRDLKGDAARAITDLRALANLLEGELVTLKLPEPEAV